MITESVQGVVADYEDFVVAEAVRLRRVLVAHYGIAVGTEVASDTLAWAWEHWDELATVDNRVGYLYRVAQSQSRRYRRWGRKPRFPVEAPSADGGTEPDPGLPAALARLPEAHRVAVLLVHAHGWSYAEVADALGVPVSTVTNHVHRGMQKLRLILGAEDER